METIEELANVVKDILLSDKRTDHKCRELTVFTGSGPGFDALNANGIIQVEQPFAVGCRAFHREWWHRMPSGAQIRDRSSTSVFFKDGRFWYTHRLLTSIAR